MWGYTVAISLVLDLGHVHVWLMGCWEVSEGSIKGWLSMVSNAL